MLDSAPEEPVSLKRINPNVPYREAVESCTLPPVELLSESHPNDFDLKTISHVVVQ